MIHFRLNMSYKGFKKLQQLYEIIRDARQVEIRGWMPDHEREDAIQRMRTEHLSKLTYKQLWKLEEMLNSEIETVKRWQ